MASDPRPYSTLRKIAAGSADIRVVCSQCGHEGPLPLAALAARIGWDTDFLAPDVLRHMRCPKCGLAGKRRHTSGHHITLKILPLAPGMGSAEPLSGW